MKKILGILVLAVILIFSAGCIDTDNSGEVSEGDTSLEGLEDLAALSALFSSGGMSDMSGLMGGEDISAEDAESLAALSALFSSGGMSDMSGLMGSEDISAEDAESLAALSALLSQGGMSGMGGLMGGDSTALLAMMMSEDSSQMKGDLSGYPSEEELQQILQMYGGLG